MWQQPQGDLVSPRQHVARIGEVESATVFEQAQSVDGAFELVWIVDAPPLV
jgi:hypothetical protein